VPFLENTMSRGDFVGRIRRASGNPPTERCWRLRFDVKIPNEATRQAIEEARARTGLTRHTSVAALLSGEDNA